MESLIAKCPNQDVFESSRCNIFDSLGIIISLISVRRYGDTTKANVVETSINSHSSDHGKKQPELNLQTKTKIEHLNKKATKEKCRIKLRKEENFESVTHLTVEEIVKDYIDYGDSDFDYSDTEGLRNGKIIAIKKTAVRKNDLNNNASNAINTIDETANDTDLHIDDLTINTTGDDVYEFYYPKTTPERKTKSNFVSLRRRFFAAMQTQDYKARH